MSKQIVLCFDGTNNKVQSRDNTNVLRTYQLLGHADPQRQVSFYQPGVGTFSAPGAWIPTARKLSRVLGLAFGIGLRQNVGNAYAYLMATYKPGDELYVFGFSRGAYTARATTGMLAAFGLFRPGSEDLIPYALSAMSTGNLEKAPRTGPAAVWEGQSEPVSARTSTDPAWSLVLEFAETFARRGLNGAIPVSVRFLGLWDTVEAAGTLRGPITWPFTRHLPHVQVVRHAISIDEKRRPFASYPVQPLDPGPDVIDQDLAEVWFAGVHSDVGGMFNDTRRLSDIPLKWMVQEAVVAGLSVEPRAYTIAQDQVRDADATDRVHVMNPIWALAGPGRRKVPATALVHASVHDRIAGDARYGRKIPESRTSDLFSVSRTNVCRTCSKCGTSYTTPRDAIRAGTLNVLTLRT